MEDKKNERIVFGGGCFWCTQAIFKMIKGVISVAPGYAGGVIPYPTYEQVCSGKTGHAEVIQIIYSPEIIRFEDLLTVFFATHDPTSLNRQGNDIGTEYRSVIFYTTEDQRQQAETFIQKMNSVSSSGGPIVTEIKPLDIFYPAENYHNDYFARNKDKPYCQLVINPKLEKVKEKFAELLKVYQS